MSCPMLHPLNLKEKELFNRMEIVSSRLRACADSSLIVNGPLHSNPCLLFEVHDWNLKMGYGTLHNNLPPKYDKQDSPSPKITMNLLSATLSPILCPRWVTLCCRGTVKMQELTNPLCRGTFSSRLPVTPLKQKHVKRQSSKYLWIDLF